MKRSLTLKTLGVSLALWASGGCRATDPTPDAPAPLAAPVVSQPTNGVRVTAPLAVAGQTSAGYRISLTVFRSGEPLAQRTVLPQSDGQWSASVPFAAADGAIQLWVESVDGALRSAPVVVDLMLTGGDARLAAPTVTEPDGDATVFGAVGVRGTASAAAPISVLVRTDNQAIGGGATVANASGHFAVTIPYDANVNVGQTLTVQVVQSGENGVSTATEVDVVHGVTTELTGTVTDPNPHPGADVFVRAYRADADGLISVGEAAIFVSDGAAFENRNFSLDLPAGDYVIRAFRDAGSPTGNGPDTEPSLGIDAQSPPEPIRVTDTPISLDLTIQPPAFAPPLPIFDVYTRNESIDTYSPPADDDDNGSVVGAESADRGQCGGFYLRIEVESTGTVLQDPKVRLPDGSVVSPLDDGGCGFDGDNRGFSYDRQASDGQFTYGVPEPSEALTGDFALAVHGPDEQIGVLVDRIERIKRLSRRLVLVSPSGLDRVSVVRPELTWTTVADAVSYRIDVNGGGVNRSVSGLTAPRYTLEEDLADASSVQVQIDAADGDRAMGQDVDAESWGIPNRFVVDTTGLRSTKIDGTIVNTTGLTAPIYIEAGTSFSPSSTAWLTADATTFSLFAIAESNDADGYVESYLDVDGTGDRSRDNTAYRVIVNRLRLENGSATGPVELTFREPLRTFTPRHNAVIETSQPNFTWAEYTQTEPWSWALFVSPTSETSGGLPPNLFGLPASVTSYTLGQATDVRDIGLLARCLTAGSATFDATTWTCSEAVASSETTLDSGSWRWGIVVIPCDFTAADYALCVESQLQSEPPVSSVETTFEVR